MEKMVGQKDSAPANRMLQHALQDKTQLLGPHLRYSEKLWNPNGVYCGDTAPGAVDRTDPYLYIRAARKHQSFVLNELLPDVGLVVR